MIGVTRLRAMSGKKRVGLGVAVLALLFVAFLVVGYTLTKVPQPNSIATAEATTLTYNDGTVMGKIGKNRKLVDLSQVSQPARKAVLAAEDRRFYSEPGISFTGIGRALYTNIAGGGVSQGGSTITQQYAKNAFLTQQRTYTRKVKEVFLEDLQDGQQGQGPRGLPEHDLLRPRCLRDPGGVPDLLQQERQGPHGH